MGSPDGDEQAVEIARPPAAAPAPARARMVPVLAAVLGLAAACWVIAVRQMTGMDMGVATQLGSFAFFIGMWVPMTAAMMLPGTFPAVARHTRGRLRAVPYVRRALPGRLDPLRPRGLRAVPPARDHRRRRDRDRGRRLRTDAAEAGLPPPLLLPRQRLLRFTFSLCCVGSTVGLMLMQIAFGIMSITWLVVVAVIAGGQKLLPRKRDRRAAGAGDRRARTRDSDRALADSRARAANDVTQSKGDRQ